LVLTLSYSKRIDRPQIDQLRPYRVQSDVLTIIQGNPRLRDQSTDAYEINLHYRHNKVDAGLIVYDRETSRLISQSYFVDAAGRNVSTWVNAGRQRDRGAEIDVSAPILARVKVNASVNLFDSRVPVDAVIGDATDERFRFTTNSTLEWDGPDRRGKPGDVAQLNWHYESPSTQFQFRNFGWHQMTLSYTHNFTRELSITATADSGALHYGHRLLAPLVQEYYRVHRRPEFKLKLMKTFGSRN
jgi:outer membrane receptor protein involved in Fe transport